MLSPDYVVQISKQKALSQTPDDYQIEKGLKLPNEVERSYSMALAYYQTFSKGIEGNESDQAVAQSFVQALLSKSFQFRDLCEYKPAQVSEEIGESSQQEGLPAANPWPITFEAVAGQVPVVVIPASESLDKPHESYGDGKRRRDPFSLCQEYLNAHEHTLWGLVSNGQTLRLLRQNNSITRPAWIEFDLKEIFSKGNFAEFTVMWLLLHSSRFGRPEELPSSSILERWRKVGQENGSRVRDKLREGVTKSLSILGQGFLSHPSNDALRNWLLSGRLNAKPYYEQLLRLVYRLIFLMTAEERDALFPKDVSKNKRSVYEQGYCLKRLRERCTRRSAHDRFYDAFEGVKIVMLGLAEGLPALGLPALGGLFAKDQCPDLMPCRISNAHFLEAVYHLFWMTENSQTSRVNWRDMDTEELGSVYESLLELEPQITSGWQFQFASADQSKGNARKTTGSYYTPACLVDVILDGTLKDLIEKTIAAHPKDPAGALLKLKIVDPSCGSGHFLLAAARRLAQAVARSRVPQSVISVDNYRKALRDVISRCIYGVDVNPMAIELCQISLWIESLNPGKPLNFLENHIRCGNSLIGATRELMNAGIPDGAFEATESDDKKIASALKKKNAKERALWDEGHLQTSLFGDHEGVFDASALSKSMLNIDEVEDDTLDAVQGKRKAWNLIRHSDFYCSEKHAADLWVSAFLASKSAENQAKIVTTQALKAYLSGQKSAVSSEMLQFAEELSQKFQVFHWFLEFPHVFKDGGFDLVLGNPPWEVMELKDEQFFASRKPELLEASILKRKKMIAALAETDPALFKEYQDANQKKNATCLFIKNSDRFKKPSAAGINLYGIFAEHDRDIMGPKGAAGFICPSTIASASNLQPFFVDLLEKQQLVRFYSFENREKLFPAVHSSFNFATVMLRNGETAKDQKTDFVFYAYQTEDLQDRERHFSLTSEEFDLLNPNTHTCPTFLSKYDAQLNLELYKKAGVFVRENTEDGNPWKVGTKMLCRTDSDATNFIETKQIIEQMRAAGDTRSVHEVCEAQGLTPVYEAKYVHQFDHRFNSFRPTFASDTDFEACSEAQHADTQFRVLTRWQMKRDLVEERLFGLWSHNWLIGWRNIARSTDMRTTIASIMPRTAVTETFRLMLPNQEAALIACLLANLNSFALDYAAKAKVNGTHLNFPTIQELPVFRPEVYERFCPLNQGKWLWYLAERVVKLVCTSVETVDFGKEVLADLAKQTTPSLKADQLPIQWNEAERFELRCELDAAFFYLYDIADHDVDHIMHAFKIVESKDQKAFGFYRTLQVIREKLELLRRL